MPSSAWANQHFFGEFTALLSLTGQQSGLPLAVFTWQLLEGFGIEMPIEGHQLLQLEALALCHPKMCASDQFVLQNPSSNGLELVEAAALWIAFEGFFKKYLHWGASRLIPSDFWTG